MSREQRVEAHFFILGRAWEFAYRNMYQCPRVGDLVVFYDTRYTVLRVEWCMDEGASSLGGQRVNIELEGV